MQRASRLVVVAFAGLACRASQPTVPEPEASASETAPGSTAEPEAKAPASASAENPAVAATGTEGDAPGAPDGPQAPSADPSAPGATASASADGLPPPPGAEPQPAKLEALQRKYAKRSAKSGDAFEITQARSWHRADYKKLMLAATKGDEDALAKLLALELDGAGAEIHSYNLEALLLGYGDEKFAAVLARQPPKVVTLVLEMLDWVHQSLEPGAPEHFRQTHPRTFAAKGTP